MRVLSRATRLPLLPALLAAGCGLDAATGLDTGDPPRDTARDDTASDDTGDDTGGDTDEPDPFDVDDDADGWSENEGDCDDASPSVHPEADDACDGLDADCDGVLDEDARGDDIHEPNDTAGEWAPLGSLVDASSLSATGALHNDDDVDRFSFLTDDPWYSSFGFTVTLSNLPSDANYRLQVGRVGEDGELTDAQETYGGGALTLQVEGVAGEDDGGTYGAVISAWGGADCARSYLLSVTEP